MEEITMSRNRNNYNNPSKLTGGTVQPDTVSEPVEVEVAPESTVGDPTTEIKTEIQTQPDAASAAGTELANSEENTENEAAKTAPEILTDAPMGTVKAVRNVYLRQGPSGTSDKLSIVKKGTIIDILEVSNPTWSKVKTEDGRNGFVMSVHTEEL